jgi:hypothetical protein
MNFYLNTKTPLNKEIRITKEYWEFIVSVKHTNIIGKEYEVIKTLKYPEFIRKSNNGEGFIITIYLTDRVKEGDEIWKKS